MVVVVPSCNGVDFGLNFIGWLDHSVVFFPTDVCFLILLVRICLYFPSSFTSKLVNVKHLGPTSHQRPGLVPALQSIAFTIRLHSSRDQVV